MRKLTLDEIKKIEVDILDYVASICKQHGLTYFLAYGTLIGAVRHKGFIPWDDDIDIAMPRKDYDKLLEILKQEKGKGKYECLIPMEDGCFYEFMKVIDTNTTLQENKIIKGKNGVWIDIFPLDGLRKEDKINYNALIILNRCRAAAVNKVFPHRTHGFLIPIEFICWKLCRLVGYKPFLKYSLKLAQKYKYDECDLVGYASSYPAHNKFMQKRWFESIIELPFEGKRFSAPAMYDEYLSTQYGDYMQLPPVQDRVSHHMDAYIKD